MVGCSSEKALAHDEVIIKTAGTIYKKIQDGIFDVSNEVSF
jgi:hypothetical protein